MPRDSYRGKAPRALTKTFCVRSSASDGRWTRLAMYRWIGSWYWSKIIPNAQESPAWASATRRSIVASSIVITTDCLASLGLPGWAPDPRTEPIGQGHGDPGTPPTNGKLLDPRGGDDTIPRLQPRCECLFSMGVRARRNGGAPEHPVALHDRQGVIGLVRRLAEAARVDLEGRAGLDKRCEERLVQLGRRGELGRCHVGHEI